MNSETESTILQETCEPALDANGSKKSEKKQFFLRLFINCLFTLIIPLSVSGIALGVSALGVVFTPSFAAILILIPLTEFAIICIFFFSSKKEIISRILSSIKKGRFNLVLITASMMFCVCFILIFIFADPHVTRLGMLVLFMPPMLLIALSTLGLFFFRNKVTKFCFLGIGLAFCTVLFLEFCVLGNFERCVKYEDQKLVEHYSQTQAEFEPLPDLSELGTTTHLEFYDYFLQEGLFQAQANALFCHYDAAEYQAQKMRLDEQYLFRTQKFDGNGSPTAEIKGYRFRVVDAQDSNYKLEDCARMILIATNDQTQEIVYLTIDDEYTYEISSFTDFINEDCGWEHMR